MTLHWWQTAVFYQIYPRSFLDSNGDGIGDLKGIINALDYLNDGTPLSLSVDAIWLNPIHPSPNYDWGYDVADYMNVHPELGDLATFDELLFEAHRRGIRIILDLVPNHTSSEHPWFLESRSSRSSAKRNWYIWAKGKNGGPPNNWKSAFDGSAWTYDAVTDEWYMHSFLPQQPDLNYRNPQVKAAMEEVMRFWLSRGVDGFRIDAVARMAKDPELRDNPVAGSDELVESELGIRVNLYSHDRPEVHDILRGFRRVTDEYGQRVLIGEVWPRSFSSLCDYLRPDELHMAFNFWLLKCPFSAQAFTEVVNRTESLLGNQAWPAWTLSNHDFPRHISRYDEPGANVELRARLAAMMLLTLRGTPFVYYGEEIGMQQVVVPNELRRDPMGRDGCRTPMQWSQRDHGGFTEPGAVPWLPCGDYRKVNVRNQLNDPYSLLSLYRKLIWTRRNRPALSQGSYESFQTSCLDCFAFCRISEDERLMVILNFGRKPLELKVPRGEILISTYLDREGESVRNSLFLRDTEGVIIACAED